MSTNSRRAHTRRPTSHQQPATSPRRRSIKVLVANAALAGLVVGALVLGPAGAAHAQDPVGLGNADSFAVLAYSGITNTGDTTIVGDVGSHPIDSQTGFGSVDLTGTNYEAGEETELARADLLTAYNDAAGREVDANPGVELGGQVLPPGVYAEDTFQITGTLTLDADGDPDARFIFQAATTLITAANDTGVPALNSRVLLVNEASPCNVVWQVGSSATFETATVFVGDVLAHTSITAQKDATFEGRLLAGAVDADGGAVTLDTNTITNAGCTAEDDPDDTTTTTLDTSVPTTTVDASVPTTATTTPTTPTTAVPVAATTTIPVASATPPEPAIPAGADEAQPTPTGDDQGGPFTPLGPPPPGGGPTPSAGPPTSETDGPPATVPRQPTTPGLPVTGMMLSTLLAAGVALVGAGAIMLSLRRYRW